MDSIQIAVKRKKRRTRKCLDEIRKRSRRNSHIFSENDYDYDNISNQNIQTNFITSKRLTLSMFPKAVRSETITRPALAELNQKPKLNLHDLVKGTKVLTTFTSCINNVENFGDNISSSNSEEYRYIKHSINSDDNISNSQDKSSESFVLLSGMNCALEVTGKGKSPDITGVSIPTPSSTVSLNENCAYNLYEEFMSDIPKYLKHNTSAHSEEDVMKKTKVFLQNFFIENCNRNYENDFLKCLKSTSTKLAHSSKDIIVHNPMDYLRLGHVGRQSLFHKINESFSERVVTPRPRSPADPPSPDSLTSFVAHAHDTPEYTFYPHRLN